MFAESYVMRLPHSETQSYNLCEILILFGKSPSELSETMKQAYLIVPPKEHIYFECPQFALSALKF